MHFQKASIPTVPRKVNVNSKWWGRGLKTKRFKRKCVAKPEFSGGGGGVGFQTEKPSMGGVWIFSGTTHLA